MQNLYDNPFLTKGSVTDGKRFFLRSLFQSARAFGKNHGMTKRRARYYRAALERLSGSTFKEIGEKLGVSSNRARDIVAKVERIIRWHVHTFNESTARFSGHRKDGRL